MRNSDDIVYHVDKPYPPIKVDKKDIKMANMILTNYAGMVSEFTAVSQYVYHHLKLNSSYPKIADAIEKIAVVEMHHLEMIGELIELLGADPRFWINRKDKMYYWDGKFIDYGHNLQEYLTYDIQAEITAIRDYKELITKLKDKNIIAIIERIIEDEELHLSIFKKLFRENVSRDEVESKN